MDHAVETLVAEMGVMVETVVLVYPCYRNSSEPL
jgi:hypothetical protein